VIIFCADLESTCVRLNEVRPCMMVAASTARASGVRRWICRRRMTLSTKYFVEAGSTSPETRLMAISTKPSARSPRRGFISAQTWGRSFHAFLRFLSLETALSLVSVAMRWGTNPALAVGCGAGDCNYMVAEEGMEKTSVSPQRQYARHGRARGGRGSTRWR